MTARVRTVRLKPGVADVALAAMPPGPRAAMRRAIRSLAADPSGRTGRLDVKRLSVEGDPAIHRVRVGEWRAAWVATARHLDVLHIFHRSEGYGWLDRLYR